MLQRSAGELAKLRGEVTRLREDARELARLKTAQVQGESDPTESAAKAWAVQVNHLKKQLEQMPERKIPELRLVTEQDWFDAVGQDKVLETDQDYREALDRLRRTAKNKLAPMMQQALKKYTTANDGQLPTDLAQLLSYLDSPIDEAILQRWQLNQTGKLSDVPKDQPLVIEKAPVDEEYDTMYLIYLNGTGAASGKGWKPSPPLTVTPVR